MTSFAELVEKEVCDRFKVVLLQRHVEDRVARKTWNLDAAKFVGQKIAERTLAKGVKQVVFDRGGYIYHGRVKALADAARESGLEF